MSSSNGKNRGCGPFFFALVDRFTWITCNPSKWVRPSNRGILYSEKVFSISSPGGLALTGRLEHLDYIPRNP